MCKMSFCKIWHLYWLDCNHTEKSLVPGLSRNANIVYYLAITCIVLLHCPIYAEIRAADSQSDFRQFCYHYDQALNMDCLQQNRFKHFVIDTINSMN